MSSGISHTTEFTNCVSITLLWIKNKTRVKKEKEGAGAGVFTRAQGAAQRRVGVLCSPVLAPLVVAAPREHIPERERRA